MTSSYYLEFFNLRLVLQVNIIILACLFVLSIILHFRISHQEKKEKEVFQKINQIFLDLIKKTKPLQAELFPKELLNLEIMLAILEKYHSLITGEDWDKIKELVLGKLLEKEIQRSLTSKRWEKRGLALRAFLLVPDPKKEKYIAALLKDKIPVVRFNAIACALKLKTENLINAALEALSKEDSMRRYPYRDALMQGDDFVYTTIKNRLEAEKNQKIRIAALEILSLKIGYITLNEIREDLHSSNAELRWWAVRSLENIPSKETMQILIEKVEDSEWKIKSLALRILGFVHDREAIPVLQSKINDPILWVRLNAALALKEFGEEGKEILSNITPEDKQAYETAQYVIHLPEFHLEQWRNKWLTY